MYEAGLAWVRPRFPGRGEPATERSSEPDCPYYLYICIASEPGCPLYT